MTNINLSQNVGNIASLVPNDQTYTITDIKYDNSQEYVETPISPVTPNIIYTVIKDTPVVTVDNVTRTTNTSVTFDLNIADLDTAISSLEAYIYEDGTDNLISTITIPSTSTNNLEITAPMSNVLRYQLVIFGNYDTFEVDAIDQIMTARSLINAGLYQEPSATSVSISTPSINVGDTTVMTMVVENPDNAPITSVYFNGQDNVPDSNSTTTELYFSFTPTAGGSEININDINSLTYDSSPEPGEQPLTITFPNSFVVSYEVYYRTPTITNVALSSLDVDVNDELILTISINNPDSSPINSAYFSGVDNPPNSNSTATELFFTIPTPTAGQFTIFDFTSLNYLYSPKDNV